MEKNNKECDFCGITATYLCFKCIHYFCDSCYIFMHYKQKNLNHKKEIIEPNIPIDLKCQYHPINPITLFCLDEKGNTINYLLIINYRALLLLLYL